MSRTIQFGQAFYLVYSKEELEKRGLVVNPNMYLGSAFFFCVTCNRYAYHFAMSHRGHSDCYSVCRECNTHHRDAAYPIVDPAYTEYTKTFPLNDPRD